MNLNGHSFHLSGHTEAFSTFFIKISVGMGKEFHFGNMKTFWRWTVVFAVWNLECTQCHQTLH